MTPTDSERPEIAVTADAVIFTERHNRPMVVLVERANEPFQDMSALPGGFVETNEDLADAASRELAEETGLTVPAPALIQLGAYGKPGRDPRMRVVSIVFLAVVDDLADPVGGSDASASQLVPVDQALAEGFDLAFDHSLILSDAWQATRQ